MRVRTFAQVALVAVGLVHPVAWILGLGIQEWLGIEALLSPIPLVFNRSGPVETYARRFEIELRTDSGRIVRFDRPRAVAEALEGPFTRRKVYLELFLYWDTWGAPGEPLHHAFCDPGRVARELGVREPVRAVEVRIRSAFMPPDWSRAITVGCTS